MITETMDGATARAIWQNGRWFADYKWRCKKIGEDRYRVTTNYTIKHFLC